MQEGGETCGDSKFISGVDMIFFSFSGLQPNTKTEHTYTEEELVIEQHPQFGR